MMDNFDIIRPHLNFAEVETSFYYVQILQRRKDIPELETNSKKIGSYYIKSLDDFEHLKQSILDKCISKKARAYIDLNLKSMKKVALLAMKKTAEYICNEQYDAVKNAFEVAVGNAPTIGEKNWVIDIDTKDESVREKVKSQIHDLGAQVKLQLPSKNGFHLITTPFNCQKFDLIENVDILKHGLTILYSS